MLQLFITLGIAKSRRLYQLDGTSRPQNASKILAPPNPPAPRLSFAIVRSRKGTGPFDVRAEAQEISWLRLAFAFVRSRHRRTSCLGYHAHRCDRQQPIAFGQRATQAKHIPSMVLMSKVDSALLAMRKWNLVQSRSRMGRAN